ncbi:MAG: DUF3696 domain-containing protein [Blastocatellia bacterium]
MLKSLELENFKAFGERVKIPFAPITLIFGENSSGKSSILQSLNLLKQTRESREAGALLLPRTEQGISDLGSFQDLLFDHDLNRVLSIRIDISTPHNMRNRAIVEIYRTLFWRKDESKNKSDNERKPLKEIGVELKFKRPSLEKEVFLDSINIFAGELSECVARFQHTNEIPTTIRQEVLPYLAREHRIYKNSNLKFVKCVWISNEQKYWVSRFEACREKKDSILQFLLELKEKQFDGQITLFDYFDEELPEEFSTKNKKDTLDDAIDFYSKDFSLKEFIDRMQGQQLETYLALDGFLPYTSVRNREKILPEGHHPDFRRIYSGNPLSLDSGILANMFGRVVGQTLEIFFPLGPFRRPPERWYIFTGTSPQDVGYKGELLPDLLFRRPELVEEANSWLDRLDIGYHLKVQPLGERTKDLFEVQLIDTRRKPSVEVGLPDVGFGISQLLPFIVQSLSSKEKIISIEQPEVHIHPRLQADLGNLLAETIKPPRNNQFIIETHSEHLVLRLQKLVSLKELSPNDVSILYVSRGANGSKVQQLQLDEDGDFIDDWPGGFFPERLRELR